jgi:hypothetical protein
MWSDSRWTYVVVYYNYSFKFLAYSDLFIFHTEFVFNESSCGIYSLPFRWRFVVYVFSSRV